MTGQIDLGADDSDALGFQQALFGGEATGKSNQASVAPHHSVARYLWRIRVTMQGMAYRPAAGS